MKIDLKRKVPGEIYTADAALRELARQLTPAFERLAAVSPLVLLDWPPSKEGGVIRHTQHFDVRVPLAGAVDVAAERQRLEKERERLLRQHESLTKQLANPAFLGRAPKQVVEGARRALVENAAQQKKVEETLASLV
jgi:valyl-tRNA synthetase